jgi:hypothetical protein
MKFDGLSLKIVLAFFVGLYVHNVTGYGIRHKNDPTVRCLTHRFSFGTRIHHFHSFKNEFFIVFTHGAKITGFFGLMEGY